MSDTAIQRKMDLPKFDPEDIGSIIGPSAKVCEKNPNLKKLPSLRKNVISASWRSFTNFYSEDKTDKKQGKATDKATDKVTSKEPGKIFVKLGKEDRDGETVVVAEIECGSEEMCKFVMMHLEKYQDTFKKPVRKTFFNLYVNLPHHLIPLLIGRGGSGIKNLRTAAVAAMDETVDATDLDKCEKSFLKVEPFTPRDSGDFGNYVSDNPKSDFIGWAPQEGDPLVKISVSSLAGQEGFKNFSECLGDVMETEISTMMERDKSREEERETDRRRDIDECQAALDNNDW